MDEELREWHPVPGINTPCARVDIYEERGDLTLNLIFSDVRDGEPRDLRLAFGRVVAFKSYEEFAHPWNDSLEPLPKVGGRWAGYTFPCLEVTGSRWLASFGESRLFGMGECRHFRIITLDKTVDVVSVEEPVAEWLAV